MGRLDFGYNKLCLRHPVSDNCFIGRFSLSQKNSANNANKTHNKRLFMDFLRNY